MIYNKTYVSTDVCSSRFNFTIFPPSSNCSLDVDIFDTIGTINLGDLSVYDVIKRVVIYVDNNKVEMDYDALLLTKKVGKQILGNKLMIRPFNQTYSPTFTTLRIDFFVREEYYGKIVNPTITLRYKVEEEQSFDRENLYVLKYNNELHGKKIILNSCIKELYACVKNKETDEKIFIKNFTLSCLDDNTVTINDYNVVFDEDDDILSNLPKSNPITIELGFELNGDNYDKYEVYLVLTHTVKINSNQIHSYEY